MAKFTVFALLALCLVASAQAKTVYQTAKDAGLTTLVAAIDAAGFKKILNNPNFKGTVWAPDNQAFEILLAELDTTAEALLNDKPTLRAILNYHVIPGDVLTKAHLYDIQSWGTNLKNAQITIVKNKADSLRVYYGNQEKSESSITWDGSARVIVADVKADKAIVQVINRVMIPPAK